MAVLKSYTCAKCAGVLVFDSDREYFDCPFCGTKFSYVDFHDDEIMSRADECLKCREFDTARLRYKDILVNDPHNFKALLGLVLCAAKASSVDELKDTDKFDKHDFSQAADEASVAQTHVSSEHGAYFDKLAEIAETADEIIRIRKEAKQITSYDNRKRLKGQSEYDGSFGCFFHLIFIPYMIACITLFVTFLSSGKSVIWPSVMAVAGIIALGIAVARSDKRTGKIKEENDLRSAAVHSRVLKIDEEVKDLEKKYPLLFEALEKLEPADDEAGNAEKSSEETGIDSSSDEEEEISYDRKIVCDKCGAGLNLDKIKRVYACSSCGVAYGVSLFFAHPLEKALNAMGSGYYADAEERFAHVLMVDPTDFEARLGRILSAGRWSKVSDIKVSRGVNYINVNRAKMQVKEAMKHINVKDAEYFLKLQEVMDVLSEIAVNKRKLTTAKNNYLSCDARIAANSGLLPETDDSDEQMIKKLEREIDEYRKEESVLEKRLKDRKNELIGLRSDSVLTR